MRKRAQNSTSNPWVISRLGIGTVEFCSDLYGFYRPDEPTRISRRECVEILLHAFEHGINIVDTSPGYGDAEWIVGDALEEWGGDRISVATKVPCDPSSALESIEESLIRLQVERLDMVQLANAISSDLERDDLMGTLVKAREQGKVRRLGASVYGPSDALVAVRHEAIEAVQVAFNLLDQRMIPLVFPEARARGVDILARSALLKGVLTDRRGSLPDGLHALEEAAGRAQLWARGIGEDLTSSALRYCLSHEEVTSTLVGVRSIEELDVALSAWGAGHLPPRSMDQARGLALSVPTLLDPRNWSGDN